ncbi:MAG: hypothetical protein ABGW91_09900 [Christiangramia sp.]|uniref:Uncharacterized protein n=1 Tax=Christiangramia flava JLT2011 TaxID=1229726 RepID=A0A1L7I575_9FLAO|nr:hypothetical protein [Christiangramia flava]APU68767.1 hypothetical protein GRFL_2043 [Christiangramia flava JLT2011]OSS39088.1 secreted protein [Christiangramia flava JLT2011]|tara:strand:+ start:55 stop:519 length:465 start_codon:yes stop_codon:yes gene_type:complete
MKKIFRVLGICSLFLVLVSANSNDTHLITLTVDTSAINSSNIDEVSSFGQESGVTNEEYTITVKSGDIVVWQGVSSSSEDDEVLISAINYQGGTNVFGQNTLKDTSQNPGVVIGVVGDHPDGTETKYMISFKVRNNGSRRNGTFNIDPKIMVKN